MNKKDAETLFKLHKSNTAFECRCISCEPNIDCYEAKGFLEGYKEADRLIEVLRDMLFQANCFGDRNCWDDLEKEIDRRMNATGS